VDAVPPESDEARTFGEIAARIAEGSASAEDHKQARQWLTLWRDNDSVLEPTLAGSGLASELVPVSQGLKEGAVIGLGALDAIEKNVPLSADEQARQLAALKGLEEPRAVLLLATVPGVETLVKAARR